MDKKHIDDLIIRFFSGQTAEEEAASLLAWRRESCENESYFRKMEEVWFSSLAGNVEKLFTDKDIDEAYRSFCRQSKPAKVYNMRNVWGYVAAVAVVLLMVFGAYKTGEKRLPFSDCAVRIEAPIGAKTKVTLPDGTNVCLNAGSYISYTPQFGLKTREVNVCGEAYFEVAHNEKIPFLVKSENMQVRVLGTKFDFRDYPSDKNAVVTLSEGKVNLTNLQVEGESLIMMPSDQVILDKTSGGLQKRKSVPVEAIRWTENSLSFDEEPLRDVLNALERQYNVEIDLQADSLDNLMFYGAFKTDEQTIGDVMEILSSTQKMKYHIDGRKITIN